MSSLIQVFAKAPVAGQVKTRVAQELGSECALQLHKLLCEHTVQVAKSSQADAVEIWTTAPPHHYFEQFSVPVSLQQGPELGARMAFSLQHGLARFDQVIIIGADALSLTPDCLDRAIHYLQKTEIVLGPAEDGGYVLLGAVKYWPQLFKRVPWGTNQVLARTLEILGLNAIPHRTLPAQWDIDTVADLKRHAPEWLQRLEGGESD